MVASWPLGGLEPPDVGTVGRLARLQLSARRLGYAIRVRHASVELLDLIALAGLTDVVPADAGCRTGDDAGGAPAHPDDPDATP